MTEKGFANLNQLYQEDLADIHAAGTLDVVFDDLFSKNNIEKPTEIPAIENIYKDIANWEKDIEKRSKKVIHEEKSTTNFPELPEIFRNTGRNKKCPCGSGLKFKKCHGSTNPAN